MPPYVTITGYEVTPVLGLLAQPFQPVPAPDEVDEVFFVPLAHLMDVAAYQRHAVQRDGFSGHYYAISYGDYFIWGATAAMLRRLALHLAAWSR
ncbi:putative NUDIX hydrolase [compost metagenome]